MFGSAVDEHLVKAHYAPWGNNALVRGAYASARPGAYPLRPVLRRPVGDRVWFAGEACSVDDWATVAGAHIRFSLTRQLSHLAVVIQRKVTMQEFSATRIHAEITVRDTAGSGSIPGYRRVLRPRGLPALHAGFAALTHALTRSTCASGRSIDEKTSRTTPSSSTRYVTRPGSRQEKAPYRRRTLLSGSKAI